MNEELKEGLEAMMLDSTDEQRTKDNFLLSEANSLLKTLDIKGKNYVPVNERIKAFRYIYPRGQIITEIIGLEDGICTMKASVYDNEGRLLGTGHAQEKEGSTFINKTSFIENCETSCIGRALGMVGIGLDDGFASYEEVANAMRNQEAEPKVKKITAQQYKMLKQMYSETEIKAMLNELGISKGSDMPLDFYDRKQKEYEAKLNLNEQKDYY